MYMYLVCSTHGFIAEIGSDGKSADNNEGKPGLKRKRANSGIFDESSQVSKKQQLTHSVKTPDSLEAPQASSKKILMLLPWKSSIHFGGRPSFLFTHTKKQCQTPHVGLNPTNLEEHKRWVRPRNRGR